MPKKDFFNRVNERFDDFDSGSRQAFLLRLVRDRGFFEAVFNAVEEGILVIDPQLRIRYFNRAASEPDGAEMPDGSLNQSRQTFRSHG